VIVIDPGHQARADSTLEPIGPGSSTKKAKVSGGTSSRLTGIPEGQVAQIHPAQIKACHSRSSVRPNQRHDEFFSSYLSHRISIVP
jgi:hypothetical protein